VDAFDLLMTACKRIADEHGFTDATPAEDIALMHSELSEALEDIRDGKRLDLMQHADNGKPIGVPSELADVVIRVLHFCGKHGINLGTAILEKMAFNETRPYKHGKIL
jgi:NTP pyrophosphatase (non-canonical NTP hydrolase)